MRTEGYAVEPILRVLRQQGLKIAARTYRAWKSPVRIAARTVTDALVEDKIRDLAWMPNPVTRQVQMTPEGLYGRRKWVALLRRQDGLAATSRGRLRAVLLTGVTGYSLSLMFVVAGAPDPLVPRMRVTNALLLAVLARPLLARRR